MNIKLKLTKRDQILLAIILLVLVVLGGIFFIVKPSIATTASLKSDLVIAKDKMELIKNNLAQKDNIESNYKEVAAKAKVAANDFFDEMLPQQIEQTIGDFLDQHYIEYSSIAVESFTQTQVKPYTFQQPVISYPIKDFTQEINDLTNTTPILTDSETTSLEEANSQVTQEIATEITQAIVTVEFISTFNNLLAFTDFVSNYEQLFRIDKLTVNLLPDASDVVKGSLSLSLKGAAKTN